MNFNCGLVIVHCYMYQLLTTLTGRCASQEQWVGLMQELDHYHYCMKTLLNLHLDPANDPRLKLIILN